MKEFFFFFFTFTIGLEEKKNTKDFMKTTWSKESSKRKKRFFEYSPSN